MRERFKGTGSLKNFTDNTRKTKYANGLTTEKKDILDLWDIEEMDEIGYEDYFYGNGLCMIEWANLIEEILPEKRHDISIEKDLEKGFDYRKIIIRELD